MAYGVVVTRVPGGRGRTPILGDTGRRKGRGDGVPRLGAREVVRVLLPAALPFVVFDGHPPREAGGVAVHGRREARDRDDGDDDQRVAARLRLRDERCLWNRARVWASSLDELRLGSRAGSSSGMGWRTAMLGFSFRGSRVSVFLRALVRRLYSATARRALSAVRAGSGSVKMLNAESTICRSAKTTARESSGVKRTALERCIATPAQIAPRRQRRPSRTAITMARPPLAPARLRDPDGYVATRERSVPIFEFRSLWGRHVDFAESVHLCARIIALTVCWPL